MKLIYEVSSLLVESLKNKKYAWVFNKVFRDRFLRNNKKSKGVDSANFLFYFFSHKLLSTWFQLSLT